MLISFAVTAKLICVFVFAYAKKPVFSRRSNEKWLIHINVLQIPKLEEDSAEEQRGALDVWQLKTVGLKLRRPGEAFCCLPMSRFTGDLINRQMNNVDLSLIKVMLLSY